MAEIWVLSRTNWRLQPPGDQYGQDKLLEGRLYFTVTSLRSFIHIEERRNKNSNTIEPKLFHLKGSLSTVLNRKMWNTLPAREQGWVWDGFTADSSPTSLSEHRENDHYCSYHPIRWRGIQTDGSGSGLWPELVAVAWDDEDSVGVIRSDSFLAPTPSPNPSHLENEPFSPVLSI